MKYKLLLLLLSLLGIPACTQQVEYGSPHADYRVSGKVTDSAGTPIPGIEVNQWEGYTEAVTNAEGNYLVERAYFESSLSLTFTDPYGPDNGGEFAEKTVPVEFTDADRIRPGDGNWYEGAYAKTVDVTLVPKPSEEKTETEEN